jgi:hypothetical protein
MPDPEKMAAILPPIVPLPDVEQLLISVIGEGKRYEGYIQRTA